MPGEQEHHISSVPFFFFITYKILTCERTLISALQALRKHRRICNTTPIKLRLYTLSKSFIKYPQISYTFYFINAILNPSQMYCSHSMTASFILSVFIHSKKSGISPHFSTITTTYLQRRTHDLTHKSIF